MIRLRLPFVRPHLGTFISGALIVLAFPKWNFYPLIWICLIPWFFALRSTKTRWTAFAQGVWLSFFMSLGGFFWVASVLREFGGLPWSVAIIGLLLFSLGNQLQFLAFAPIYRALEPWKREASGARLLGLVSASALLYAGIDWLLPKLFVDTLGHSLYLAENIRQVVDTFSAHGLTFLIFLVNESIFLAITRYRGRTEPSLRPVTRSLAPTLAVTLVLALSAWSYGAWRLQEVRGWMASPVRSLQTAVIQPNIGDFDKIAAERGIRGAANKILETYYSMSDRALAASPKPEVVIWPETSYPSTFRTPSTSDELARDQAIERWVRERGVPLLFGGYDRHQGHDYNAFFFLSPQTSGEGELQIYRKNILLLFGEYIPGMEKLTFLKQLFPQIGNFGRGVGPDVLKIKEVKTGPVICYEALFPNYVIETWRKGSQFILNITNDSWFGPHTEPQLHLSLTAFRSLETRIPQLRATNTGISALMLPDGEITQATGVGEQTILHARIPIYEPHPTLMTYWGDWFGPFALLLGCLLVTMFAVRRRQ